MKVNSGSNHNVRECLVYLFVYGSVMHLTQYKRKQLFVQLNMGDTIQEYIISLQI